MRKRYQTAGAKRLAAWLVRSRLNQRQAAKQFGVHYVLVNQWLRGTRRPGLALAYLIERHTGIAPVNWTQTAVSGILTASTQTRQRAS